MSSVLSFLVGKSTSCSRLQSAMVLGNVVFTRLAYWELATVKSFQCMSGKLKSPSMRSGVFLDLALSWESSFLTVWRWWASVLFGGL